MMEIDKLIKEASRYFTFIIGGGISLLIGLGVTWGFTEYAGFWHMLSYAIALSVEIIFLFVYHTYITFKARGHFLKFALVILFITGLNWVLVYFVSVIIGVYYLIAIVLVALVVSILNYFLNRIWVFNRIK